MQHQYLACSLSSSDLLGNVGVPKTFLGVWLFPDMVEICNLLTEVRVHGQQGHQKNYNKEWATKKEKNTKQLIWIKQIQKMRMGIEALFTTSLNLRRQSRPRIFLILLTNLQRFLEQKLHSLFTKHSSFFANRWRSLSKPFLRDNSRRRSLARQKIARNGIRSGQWSGL